jgi:hypothetical protein
LLKWAQEQNLPLRRRAVRCERLNRWEVRLSRHGPALGAATGDGRGGSARRTRCSPISPTCLGKPARYSGLLRGRQRKGARLALPAATQHTRRTARRSDMPGAHSRSKPRSNEQRLDGIYIIRTSVPKEVLSSEQVVTSYKTLSNWSELSAV